MFLEWRRYDLSFARSVSDLYCTYRQISNIRRNKSQNLNVSHLAFELSLPGPLKPDDKCLRTKMLLEQRREAMLQLHVSDQQFYCLLMCIL